MDFPDSFHEHLIVIGFADHYLPKVELLGDTAYLSTKGFLTPADINGYMELYNPGLGLILIQSIIYMYKNLN